MGCLCPRDHAFCFTDLISVNLTKAQQETCSLHVTEDPEAASLGGSADRHQAHPTFSYHSDPTAVCL